MEEIRLRLASIRIFNMHNVTDKTYDFSDGFTYFRGPNGAGKSTILEAIQLVILGYIPGYSKTNEAIMKHSSADELCVVGTFDDGSVITRRWTRSGSSVSSSVETIPPMLKTDLKIIDDKLEMPIYNFNEFKDMTANKLKEWFISFLPPVDDSIEWKDKLIDVLGSRKPLLNDNLLDDILSTIDELSKSYKGVELVQQLNTYLKSEQSFTKKEIDRLESTIQNLVFYEEELPSDEKVNQDLNLYMLMLKDRAAYDSYASNYQSINQQIEVLGIPDDPSIQSVEDVESYTELLNAVSNTEVALKEVSGAKERFAFSLNSVKNRIIELSKISSSVCPYTSKECNEITLLRADNLKEIEKLNKELTDLHKLIEDKTALQSELNSKLFILKSNLEALERKYSTYFNLKNTLATLTVCNEPPLSKEEIDAKIKNCQESLSKIEANKKYRELVDTITEDKYKQTNNLEVLKIWIKMTDANGLQTELMTKPFENLGAEMGKYLTEMFGQPTEAHFNLSTKANSFSFGLIRNSKYIEFDYLSAGERCLFMLAMMICLLDRSNTEFRTILVDDLIDHLDDNNANNVYTALSNVEDVQFILAGVKECSLLGVVDI